jgi:DNA-binding transcriptional ArsR family regulator
MQEVLRALAEPRRQEILRLLSGQELASGEVATHFSVSRPAISQHLQVLKAAELVSERVVGTRHLYRARPEGLAELRDFLEGFWDSALARLSEAAAAEQERINNERSGSA